MKKIDGIRYDKYGYAWEYCPNHPYSKSGRVKRARLVMENKLGRYLLPEEIVHHINGVKNDDTVKNLQLCSSENEHHKIHFSGDKNIMYNTSLFNVWKKKYGLEEAKERLLKFKQKQINVGKETYKSKNGKLTFQGKQHSEESKRKMSSLQSGKGNPMYGKSVYDIWIQKYGYDKAMEMKIADIEKKRLGRIKNGK